MGIHGLEWLEQVEGVLETLNEGVIVSDGDARILSVNSRFEELIGMPRAENCGKRSLPFLYS
jgi:PAS domain S-box-containing protein